MWNSRIPVHAHLGSNSISFSFFNTSSHYTFRLSTNVYVGSYGTGTGPHADPLTTDAWSTLLAGHKWCKFLHPPLDFKFEMEFSNRIDVSHIYQ